MNLTAFCIRRPAFTIVICLIMIIVGILAFINLPLRWIPNVTPPVVTINTSYPGANASLVEHDVTQVIEGALSGISGIETLDSDSKREDSQIQLTFKLGYNMDTAVEDVRSSVERVRGSLPRDIDNPVVSKDDPNSRPIMYITFADDHRTQRELSDYVDKYIVPPLETTDGVGSVLVFGKQVTAMRIWLDPNKMAGANVTVDEVSQVLHDQNASIPSGQIHGKDRLYDIVTDTSLKTPDQFNDLIIRDNQNQVIRLKDVGDAKMAAENTDSIFRFNGKPAVALAIIPQSTANPLEVEKHVQLKMKEIIRALPSGMQTGVVGNQADFIRASIHSVYESFFESILFVWIVIFVFLCSLRATLIPILTIPVCMVSTFAILYILGFSINTITLMAFVLAIGLVVDDAIVMLENISRHIEQGMSAFAAALKGSREIVFPIIAMTLTLSAVYAPIAFTPGILGALFKEFTFTLAGAVLISGFVALTLSPMMCARILSTTKETRYSLWLNRKLTYIQERYQTFLGYVLQKRKWVVLALVLASGVGIGAYFYLPSELTPTEDMHEIDVSVSAPRNSSFVYTDNYVQQLEAIYKNMPGIQSYFSAVGLFSSPSFAYQEITLKPTGLHPRSTKTILTELMKKQETIPGVKINAYTPPPPLAQFTGEGSTSVGMVIMTSSDYRKLGEVTQRIVDELKQDHYFPYVDHQLKWDSQQFQVNLDRNRAADLKVPLSSITNTLSTLFAGRTIGKADDANIIVQMDESALANPNIFQQLYVRNTEGTMVPLTQLMSVNEITSPNRFHRYERLRSDTIYVGLAPNMKISEAVKRLQTIAKEKLPDDMKFTFTGEAKSFLESTGKTLLTFLLALAFIYLVLVAQFESFIDPLVILLTVPFAIVGAMLTLNFFGGSLNIYSNIGMITLIGLIAKHGILITEFANRLRREGKSIHEAVIEASMLRLRPILMTTSAMVLGALPLAFAFGPGAESRQQVGLVIVGGLIFGTFFSLVVVPVAYTFLSPFRKLTPLTSE